MPFTFNSKNLVHRPDDLKEFIDDLIKRLIEEGHYCQGENRRREPRHSIAIQLHAIPLDNDLQPVGKPSVDVVLSHCLGVCFLVRSLTCGDIDKFEKTFSEAVVIVPGNPAQAYEKC